MGLRGGQQQLLLLARGLHKRGHDQLIVCPESSALESQTRQEGFRVFSLPPHDPAHAHGIFQLRQQLIAEPFEILHSHDGRGQTIAWLASCGLPVRRVASRRVTFLPRSATLHRLKYGLTCDAVIAVSSFVRQQLIHERLPESKIEVIPDGAEIAAELPSAETHLQLRPPWSFDREESLLHNIDTFTRKNGQDVAIQPAALLHKN